MNTVDAECPPASDAGRPGMELWQELGDSLQQAQAAVLLSDLRQLGCQTARQRELCARLHQTTVTEGWGEPIRKIAEQTRSYAAVLRRARRTVDIFCRVLASSALTYPPPRGGGASFVIGPAE